MSMYYSGPQYGRGSQERQLAMTYRADADKGIDLTIEWVQDRLSEGRILFGEFYQQCDWADRYYDVKFTLNLDEDIDPIPLPTLRTSINLAMAQISAGSVDIAYPPRSRSTQEVAERVEVFLENNRKMLDTYFPTDEQLVIQALLYGIGFKKIEVNIEALRNLPSYDPEIDTPADRRAYADAVQEEFDRTRTIYPFHAGWVDPREMMWDFASHEPKWVMWTHKVEASWVQGHFPDWYRDDSQPTTAYVELTEVWTKNQVAFYADDRWVMEPMRHPYGMIPFVMYHPVLNRETRYRMPHYRYQGVGYGIYHIIEAQSELGSLHKDITAKASTAPIDIYAHAITGEDVQNKYSTRPNARNVIPPGVEKIERGPVAEPPHSLEQGKMTLDRALEDSLFSPVSSTAAGRSATSGLQVNVLQNIATLHLTAMKSALQRGMVRENELVLRIVENVLRRTISVFGTTARDRQMATITPDDIKGHYTTVVEINADTPDEKQRKVTQAREGWMSGFIDKETALRLAGYPNPREIVKKRFVEDIMMSEPILAQFIQAYGQRFALLMQSPEQIPEEAETLEEQLAELITGQNAPEGGGLNAGTFSPGNVAGGANGYAGGELPSTSRLPAPGTQEGDDLARRQAERDARGGRLPA